MKKLKIHTLYRTDFSTILSLYFKEGRNVSNLSNAEMLPDYDGWQMEARGSHAASSQINLFCLKGFLKFRPASEDVLVCFRNMTIKVLS